MDILITEDLDAPAIRRLAEQYEVVRDDSLWKDAAKLRTAIRDARTIMIRNQTNLTAALLDAAPNLIGIGRVGVGLDNVDVQAASKLGVVVIAPLDANATSVAEFTIALLLALARKIPSADRSTKAGGWDRKGCTGLEVDGKTLTICGFGRIGRKVGALAHAFGMQVLVYDPFVEIEMPDSPVIGATFCQRLEDALAEADFVTTHAPLTPETRHMFDTRTFAMMKRGAFFINTSRGGMVDEAALLQALQSGHLGGAALDVRETEPPRRELGFATMENVILTPHIASFTAEAQARTFEAVAADIDRLLRGEVAIHFVNMARPQRETFRKIHKI